MPIDATGAPISGDAIAPDVDLKGKVAVVTGASRSIGKGIALELGAAGATVYVTGRTLEPGAIPGTIGETAAQIEALGGVGIAVPVDHHQDDQVTALFERVKREHGKLDILVNNVYSAPELAPWLGKKYWELPIEAWDRIINVGTRSHYVAAVLATPLLFAAGGGLIVNVSSSGAVTYAHNVVYGVGKAAVDKMTADMAVELEGTGVSIVSVWPGLVRNEMLDAAAVHDGDQIYIELPGEGRFDLGAAESPRFVGRGVVALAGDPKLAARAGKTFGTTVLAKEFGFTDTDGRVPKVSVREGH